MQSAQRREPRRRGGQRRGWKVSVSAAVSRLAGVGVQSAGDLQPQRTVQQRGPESAVSTDAQEQTSLSIELERATLRALSQAYDALNLEYFSGSLRRPPISLGSSTSRLGVFTLVPRGLELNRSLVLDRGWGIAIEVLKHEMAHPFVIEHLGDPDGAPHGPTFRRVCHERGF